MIKKMLMGGVMAAAAAVLVPQAQAQTFSPTGPFTFADVNGPITVQIVYTFSCRVNGDGAVDAAGNATVTSLALSGGSLGLCGAITFTGMPYTVSGTSPGTVTIHGVTVTGISGRCAGDLTGSYNQSTGIITFLDARLPSTSGVTPCRIYGKVKVSPTLTF